jgi:hypothetical protein
MNKPSGKAPRTRNPRRTFSVEGQLLGKLGPSEYGALLDRLHQAARPAKRRSRRRPARKGA